MKRLCIVILGAAMCASACGTSASDTDTSLDPTVNVIAAAPAGPRPAPMKAVVPPQPRPAAVKAKPAAPTYRDVTMPAGTTLSLKLMTAVASDTSRLEDPIYAELTGPVTIDGRQVVLPGAKVTGVVTGADESGRVKGRARVALEFTSLHTGGVRYDMKTEPFSMLAPATKGEDAAKVGIGAGAGAAIGAILGGKKGAAQGAAVGGGAGTGVVLATRGKEVRLAEGADVTTHLTAPLTVRLGGE